MKLITKASIIYFPLILIYKLFGVYDNNYWVNYSWFITSFYMMLAFVVLRKFCIDNVSRWIITSVVFYWGIMAALRLYLFTNINLYKKIISSANTLTIGSITIVLILIYLTSRIKWFKK